MAKFRTHAWKDAADGSRLLLLSNVHDGSWFIRKRRDPSLDRGPMGAFCSSAAARRWADQTFPGGDWHE